MVVTCVQAGGVFSVIPSYGAHVGSTLVTIFGQFSTTTDYLAFWETSYTSVKTISSTQLEVITPYHSPGIVRVKLFTLAQQQQIGNFPFIFVEVATAISVYPPLIAANVATTITMKSDALVKVRAPTWLDESGMISN